MKLVLFAVFHIYIGDMQMFDLYIVYIFIVTKVNQTSLKNTG